VTEEYLGLARVKEEGRRTWYDYPHFREMLEFLRRGPSWGDFAKKYGRSDLYWILKEGYARKIHKRPVIVILTREGVDACE
jgi:hypothetical protein